METLNGLIRHTIQSRSQFTVMLKHQCAPTPTTSFGLKTQIVTNNLLTVPMMTLTFQQGIKIWNPQKIGDFYIKLFPEIDFEQRIGSSESIDYSGETYGDRHIYTASLRPEICGFAFVSTDHFQIQRKDFEDFFDPLTPKIIELAGLFMTGDVHFTLLQ
jgi:hypothetical protein